MRVVSQAQYSDSATVTSVVSDMVLYTRFSYLLPAMSPITRLLERGFKVELWIPGVVEHDWPSSVWGLRDLRGGWLEHAHTQKNESAS